MFQKLSFVVIFASAYAYFARALTVAQPLASIVNARTCALCRESAYRSISMLLTSIAIYATGQRLGAKALLSTMPTEVEEEPMEVEVVVAEDDDDEDDDDDTEPATEVAAEENEAAADHEDVELAQPEAEEDQDGDDDDEEEVLAAAVVVDDDDDDDDDVDDEQATSPNDTIPAAVAEAVDAPVTPSKNNKPSPAKSTSPLKSSGSSNEKKSIPRQSQAGDSKKSSTKRPTGGSSSPKSAAVHSIDELYKSVPSQKLAAARDARAMLQETVPTLPVPVAETQVRSFGRLCIQSLPASTAAKKTAPSGSFNTTSALYPIGFSCDRYEFSPVHGRILKMRCCILDGKSVKANQVKGDFPVQADLPDGPIFRIMWGLGVDEDAADERIDYPFDLHVHSPPLVMTGSSKGDALIKEAVKSKRAMLLPEEGMRVKVRFAKEQYFPGIIMKVGEPETVTTGKKKRKQVEVMILYDDGVTETLIHPDPDLVFVMPGTFHMM